MTKQSAVPETPIRILKISSCTTLSGRSELTYHIGCNAESEVYLRVISNSGNGQFNADSIPLATIEELLTAHPADKPITSRVLQPVFRSKSTNSPAFLFACLKAEGVIKAGEEKDSGYLLGEIETFKQAMSALITVGTDLSTTPDASRQRKQKERK